MPIDNTNTQYQTPNFNTKYLGRSRYNTPSECMRRCSESDNGYAFAGVQYGR